MSTAIVVVVFFYEKLHFSVVLISAVFKLRLYDLSDRLLAFACRFLAEMMTVFFLTLSSGL